MSYAPIALFTYARKEHTIQTVQALQNNPLAAQSDLIIFSDAARSRKDEVAVAQVRDYLPAIRGFASVTLRLRPHNFGLARSITEGVSEVLQDHERVIVMEDDLVAAPGFLTYMNEALERFEHNEQVISIHGYMYPVEATLPSSFFLYGANCWGWATWRRGWQLFNHDGAALLAQLRQRNLGKAFDFNGNYPYTAMLERQTQGKNGSWAIRWYASAFLAQRLTLYPGTSLIQNIGHDGSGEHCTTTSHFHTTTASGPVDLSQARLEDCAQARRALEIFFAKQQGGPIKKLLRRIKYALF